MYDLEEQEQIDELKAWWKQYGRLVIVVVTAVVVAGAGTAGWQWYKRSQSEHASQLYGRSAMDHRQRSRRRRDRRCARATGRCAARREEVR
jgi:predicted negative regulator of RcsB-dependent stress response